MRLFAPAFAIIVALSAVAAAQEGKPIGDHITPEPQPTFTEVMPTLGGPPNAPPDIALPTLPKLQTAVVVTACQQIVVVYVTSAEGRLFRFDKDSKLSTNDMLALANSATRSERVEVDCPAATELPLGAR